ncbi:MAG TPA: hypothetical protein VLM41_10185 [Steroidobacteraceae bacterium]|nr:hypothetical protein [Steroidobacteraceae bacterium]
MKTRSLFAGLLTLALAALLTAGCANRMEPARKAIADVEAALAASGSDATKYIPGRVRAVETQIANLKTMFDKQDYKGVLSAAPAALAQAEALAFEASAARQAAMEAHAAEWATLITTLPGLLAAIDARVSVLAKARKLPDGISAEQLQSVQAQFAETSDLWTRATAAHAVGELEQAVALGVSVKKRADELLAALGMSAG